MLGHDTLWVEQSPTGETGHTVEEVGIQVVVFVETL